MAKSKWEMHKDAALALRRKGISMTVIEQKLGIPRSTLSGWFKAVILTEEQRTHLMKNKQDGWLKARQQAVIAHRNQKTIRLLQAKEDALSTLKQIDLTPAILDLAFAMLYFGEGAKSNTTSLASSDPVILRFVIAVLRRNYLVTPENIRCDLHLRMDQKAETLKNYWSKELNIPLSQFRYVAHDKRSEGKKTYENYKGVCVLTCGNIAIQRKLVYLYTLFCEKITELEDVGA